MPKKKSAILEAVHETATGLHKAGLMEQTTLREFDSLCLSPIQPLEPKQIKEIRESSHGNISKCFTHILKSIAAIYLVLYASHKVLRSSITLCSVLISVLLPC